MINNLKLHIQAQVLDYIPQASGMTIQVLELDQGYSETEFIDKPSCNTVLWHYPFKVQVTYPTGSMNENDRITLDNATNDYRLAVSKEMSFMNPIAIDNEVGEWVKLEDINSFQRALNTDSSLYVFTINLEYKHLETY